jgi:hypothetical protein
VSIVYRPPALDKAAPIVDPDTGRITPYFQRFWQNLSLVAEAGGNVSVDVSNKVDKGTSTGWSSPTGTASKSAFATYAAPVAGAAYSQAQMQAVMDHLQVLSQHTKAVIDGLKTSQTFT